MKSSSAEAVSTTVGMGSLSAKENISEDEIEGPSGVVSGENHYLNGTKNSPSSDPEGDDSDSVKNRGYSKQDLTLALQSMESEEIPMSRIASMYGIPESTLWQTAKKRGIKTKRKEPTNKTWTVEDLQLALTALRKKEISANKASKLYGIPSSTLYKIARKENIPLATPFNAVTTPWSPEDLEKALAAIRGGMAVQKASNEFGIPPGTLYGRCKKNKIGLNKAATATWSEGEMTKALSSVQAGGMSINQASTAYSLPYSSLYGRIHRLKKANPEDWKAIDQELSLNGGMEQYESMLESNPFNSLAYMPPTLLDPGQRASLNLPPLNLGSNGAVISSHTGTSTAAAALNALSATPPALDAATTESERNGTTSSKKKKSKR